MNNWISIVVLLGIVIAAGLVRERWRVSRIESWARAKGLAVLFPVPEGGPQPAASLVSHLTIHGGRLWGMVLTGTIEGVPITIAEHESSEPGQKTGVWSTIVTWPLAEPAGLLILHRGTGPSVLADVAKAIVDPVRDAVLGALGTSAPIHTKVETPGGWSVYGEPLARERWLTPDKTRELDAWPHDGSFVRDQGFAGWRVKDPINADSLAVMLERLPAARRLMK